MNLLINDTLCALRVGEYLVTTSEFLDALERQRGEVGDRDRRVARAFSPPERRRDGARGGVRGFETRNRPRMQEDDDDDDDEEEEEEMVESMTESRGGMRLRSPHFNVLLRNLPDLAWSSGNFRGINYFNKHEDEEILLGFLVGEELVPNWSRLHDFNEARSTRHVPVDATVRLVRYDGSSIQQRFATVIESERRSNCVRYYLGNALANEWIGSPCFYEEDFAGVVVRGGIFPVLISSESFPGREIRRSSREEVGSPSSSSASSSSMFNDRISQLMRSSDLSMM